MKQTPRVINVANDILLIHDCRLDDLLNIVDEIFIDISYSIIVNDRILATGLYILNSKGFVYSETLYQFIKNKMNSQLISKLKANPLFTKLPYHLQELIKFACIERKNVSVLNVNTLTWNKKDLDKLRTEISMYDLQPFIWITDKKEIIISNGIHNHINYIDSGIRL